MFLPIVFVGMLAVPIGLTAAYFFSDPHVVVALIAVGVLVAMVAAALIWRWTTRRENNVRERNNWPWKEDSVARQAAEDAAKRSFPNSWDALRSETDAAPGSAGPVPRD